MSRNGCATIPIPWPVKKRPNSRFRRCCRFSRSIVAIVTRLSSLRTLVQAVHHRLLFLTRYQRLVISCLKLSTSLSKCLIKSSRSEAKSKNQSIKRQDFSTNRLRDKQSQSLKLIAKTLSIIKTNSRLNMQIPQERSYPSTILEGWYHDSLIIINVATLWIERRMVAMITTIHINFTKNLTKSSRPLSKAYHFQKKWTQKLSKQLKLKMKAIIWKLLVVLMWSIWAVLMNSRMALKTKRKLIGHKVRLQIQCDSYLLLLLCRLKSSLRSVSKRQTSRIATRVSWVVV